MIVKLLTEHHSEFLSLKEGCTGSSESSLVKMSNCWKSHAAAHINSFFCVESGISIYIQQSNFCLFDLILYVPSTTFQLNRDRSSWVEPVLS